MIPTHRSYSSLLGHVASLVCVVAFLPSFPAFANPVQSDDGEFVQTPTLLVRVGPTITHSGQIRTIRAWTLGEDKSPFKITGIRLAEAPFPYRSFRLIEEFADRSWLDVRVAPEINTRYRITLLFENSLPLSVDLKALVAPRQFGPKVGSKDNSVRVGTSVSLLSNLLLGRWNSLSGSESAKRVYQRCGAERRLRLIGTLPAKTTVRGGLVRVEWVAESLRLHRCDGRVSVRIAAPVALPGMLPGGDTGSGEPGISRREYRRAVRALGRPIVLIQTLRRLPGESHCLRACVPRLTPNK